MKIIFSFLIALLTANQCSHKEKEQQSMPDMEIVYETSSMTKSDQIVINAEKVRAINLLTQEKEERVLSNKERNELEEALSQINLNTIGELKAPTNKRLYDGAPYAILIIRSENKEIKSCGFDHGEPPQELKKLVDEIIRIGNSKK